MLNKYETRTIEKIEWRLRAYKNNNDYFNSKYYLEKFFKREIEARFFSNILNNENGEGIFAIGKKLILRNEQI